MGVCMIVCWGRRVFKEQQDDCSRISKGRVVDEIRKVKQAELQNVLSSCVTENTFQNVKKYKLFKDGLKVKNS